MWVTAIVSYQSLVKVLIKEYLYLIWYTASVEALMLSLLSKFRAMMWLSSTEIVQAQTIWTWSPIFVPHCLQHSYCPSQPLRNLNFNWNHKICVVFLAWLPCLSFQTPSHTWLHLHHHSKLLFDIDKIAVFGVYLSLYTDKVKCTNFYFI